ncbi:NAD(P)/FAD-dependent oxidoreductase [Mycobacterium hubeiense]|uniref:NAD(P)/FAD-dependent oxidoreductase n=1 Tax=Mycobacterium hubeiense TaxID=1867256 RepID=UPI000C7ED162|nr:NAD(P)/FAD-dependent oxidoreductase [Mycobacterium sp. QGD 101]
MSYDAVIVGTGPAGLSAALTLGRVRRATLLIDGGPGRNAPSDGVHNFLSRDGIAPGDLRKIALEQLTAYPSVEVRTGHAESATAVDGEFDIALADSDQVRGRRLLLATGVVDNLPAIPGLAERWGRSVVHCPYCHGWERRDLPLAVLALDEKGVQQAIQLRRFSPDVVLCLGTDFDLDTEQRQLLAARDVTVVDKPLTGVEGEGDSLQWLTFADGSRLERSALFVHGHVRQSSELPTKLGCRILDDGAVEINDLGQTSVPGVYAAGDMARRPTMPVAGAQVILAAAEGTVAAGAIDLELLFTQP